MAATYDEEIIKDLGTIFTLIEARTGHDFSNYKVSTMYRRITKRANTHRIDNLPEYIEYLKRNPEEMDLLFQEVLINVTSFSGIRKPLTLSKRKH